MNTSIFVRALFCVLTLSIFSLSAYSQTVTLGKLVTFTSETDEFVVNKAKVTAFSSTSGFTLSRRKCHAQKTRTGQGFPYRYNYESFSASKVANVSIKDKTITISNLDEAVSSAKKKLSDLVPFYCGRVHNMSLEVEVLVDGGIVKSYLSLGKDSQGLYVKKPYGRVYVDNGVVDIIPTL